MEDNPGEATTEREEQLAALQSEAKDMRKELEIAAGGLLHEYEEDGFEDDEFEPPEEQEPSRNSARRELTVDVLEHSGSSQDAPTPLAVRQMALALEEINSSSIAAAQNRSANSTAGRVSSRGRPRTGGEEEYGYGDEDFEAEFEEAVDSASSQRLFAGDADQQQQQQQQQPDEVEAAEPAQSPVAATADESAKGSTKSSPHSPSVKGTVSPVAATSPYQSPTTHSASPAPTEHKESATAATAAEQEDADGYEDEFDADDEEPETALLPADAPDTKPAPPVAALSNQQEEAPLGVGEEQEEAAAGYAGDDFDEYDMSFEA